VPTVKNKWQPKETYRPLPLLQLLVSETSSFRRSFLFDRSYSTCTPLYANWEVSGVQQSRICGLRIFLYLSVQEAYKKWQKRRGMRGSVKKSPTTLAPSTPHNRLTLEAAATGTNRTIELQCNVNGTNLNPSFVSINNHLDGAYDMK
jgi:hypothetical protein